MSVETPVRLNEEYIDRYSDICNKFSVALQATLENGDNYRSFALANCFYSDMNEALNMIDNRYEIDIQSFLQERKELHYYVADLNNLKITNDKFGHLAGDGLIRDMAYILQDAFSEDGYVYRIGGDEFAVIYMGSETQETMLNAVEQVCKKVNRNRSIPVRYAIGYAKYDKDQNTWKEVWEQADASMYKDKLSNPERIKYEE